MNIDKMVEEVNAMLADFTYKRDWKFRCIGTEAGPVLLVTIENLPSSRGERIKDMRLSHRRPIPVFFFKKDGSIRHGGRKMFLWFLRNKIRFLELHEMDEFFKYKGVAIFNPHTNAAVNDGHDLDPILLPMPAEMRIDEAIHGFGLGEPQPV